VRAGFWWEILRERIPLDNLGIYGRMILNGSLKNWMFCGVDRSTVHQDRGTWRALVYTAVNFRYP
jgi:hypothetical protein